MRRDFIANAAHELRTPLTNLQGYLEALRDGVIAAGPGDLRLAARGGRAARPAVPLARRAGRRRRGDGPPPPDRARPGGSHPGGRRAGPADPRTRGLTSTSMARASAGPRRTPTSSRRCSPTCSRTRSATRRRAAGHAPRGAPRRHLLVSSRTRGDGIPADDLPRLRALLPRREVARPRPRRRRHRPRHRQAARGGRGGRVGAESARGRRGSGSACRPDGVHAVMGWRCRPSRSAAEEPEPLDRPESLAEEGDSDHDRDRRTERRREPDHPGRSGLEPCREGHEPDDVEDPASTSAPTTRAFDQAGPPGGRWPSSAPRLPREDQHGDDHDRGVDDPGDGVAGSTSSSRAPRRR